MSESENRLLHPNMIPESLWDRRLSALLLPAALASAYKAMLHRNGLYALAFSRTSKDSPTGGLSKEKTDEHFAQAFDGSVARTSLALLDPHNHVAEASNAFIRSLSGGRLSLTDAPCGCGAASLAFLTCIGELRLCGVLPREPLHVRLIGAELSEAARQYAQEITSEITEFLRRQAIFVEATFIRWDATDALSNTDLIRDMTVAAVTHPRRLLVVANFSGFLERESKWKDVSPKLGELFRHSSGDNSVVIWIEPSMKIAVNANGLFSRIGKMIADQWRRFARLLGQPDSNSEALFVPPLRPETTARVRLAVMPIELVRRDR